MNLLVVLADDMRYDQLRYMPRVRRLFPHVFSACRKNTPVCGPERVGFLKGQYSKRHGVYAASGIGAEIKTDVLPEWLGTAGVTTGLFGKYVQNVTTEATPWDHLRALVNNSEVQSNFSFSIYNGTTTTQPGLGSPGAHVDDYFATEISSFVTAQSPGPWFAWWTPTTPHVHQTNFLHLPHPLDYGRWGWLADELALTIESDLSDKPSWLQGGTVTTDAAATATGIRGRIVKQIRELNALDRAVETVIDAIDAAGDLDDTVIVFTSDNGVHYAEHGYATGVLASKNTAYEDSVHVPCLARGPGFPAGTTDVPVNGQDLTALALDIFSATATITQDGISLADIAASPGNYTARELLHQGRDLGSPYPESGATEGWDAISTATRKLVRWTDQTSTDEFELYDLDTDPEELVNVANDAGRLTERNTLEAALDALLL